MAGAPAGAALRQVERIFGGEGTVAGLTEAQLLDRFVETLDDAAFEAIVRRHGGAVMGVCRRLLADPHEAEDAFQATFLVLARKAGHLGRSRPLGPWLVGVAYRVASKARVASARRRRREAIAAGRRPESVPPPDPAAADLAPLLWEELHRLPSKYRDPVVLCWVEGHSHDEAADRLRWPVGTVKGRLHRAKETLRSRLSSRGVGVPAACLSSWFAAEATAAAVPPPLLGSTVTAAVALAGGGAAALLAGTVPAGAATLARGALRTMFASKLSIAAASITLVGGTYFGIIGPDGEETIPASAPIATAPEPSIPAVAAEPAQGEQPIQAASLLPSPIAPAQGQQPAQSAISPSRPARPAQGQQPARGALGLPGMAGPSADDQPASPFLEFPVPDVEDRESVGALAVARAKAARDRLRAQEAVFEAGSIGIDRVLDAARALLDARRGLATSPEERHELLGSYRDYLASLTDRERAKRDAGVGSDSDLTEAALALVEAKLELATPPTAGPVISPITPSPSARAGQNHDLELAPLIEATPPAQLTLPTTAPLRATSSLAAVPSDVASDPFAAEATAAPFIGTVLGVGDSPAAAAQRRRSADPASKAIIAKLDQPMPMPFERETPLSDVLDYLRQATADDDHVNGIPIYIDVVGLSEADQSPQAPVVMNLEGIPLRTTLWLLLRQVDLAYTVMDGVLIISHRDRLHDMLLEDPVFTGLSDPPMGLADPVAFGAVVGAAPPSADRPAQPSPADAAPTPIPSEGH